MKYLLVKLNANYADEFDVDSMWVTTEEDHIALLADLKEHEDNIHDGNEIYFGTNEAIYFDNYEELMHSLDVVEITPEFYNDFLTFVGNGHGPFDDATLSEIYCMEW